jgi:phosphatidylinositol alpha-1,6-mannosyltransferase
LQARKLHSLLDVLAEEFLLRLRVLLIAEACNPTWASVPLVGYNLARALVSHPELEVTLVTQVRNRPALENDPIGQSAEVHFLDNEFIARPVYRLAQWLRGGPGLAWTLDTAMGWPSYMVFERMLYRRFRDPLRAGRWDLIHRITPLTPVVGSPLARWTPTPMILGPLNGGLPWPKEYPNLRRREREWLVPLRGLHRWLPYYRSTYRHLAGVIAGSRHTAEEIPRDYGGHRLLLPENGVDPERFPIASQWTEPKDRFTFVTVGRLVPYKGMDMILEAMAGSDVLRGCRLRIVGDGPERERLTGLVDRFGLSDAVELPGWLDQAQLPCEYRSAQVFVFPSLREFGGGVVLEAMSAALPSIIVDYGGPAELVTPESGILLPMQPRDPMVRQLRESMERLAAQPAVCRVLGQAAAAAVADQFTWARKAERIVEFYKQVLASPVRQAFLPDRTGCQAGKPDVQVGVP